MTSSGVFLLLFGKDSLFLYTIDCFCLYEVWNAWLPVSGSDVSFHFIMKLDSDPTLNFIYFYNRTKNYLMSYTSLLAISSDVFFFCQIHNKSNGVNCYPERFITFVSEKIFFS